MTVYNVTATEIIKIITTAVSTVYQIPIAFLIFVGFSFSSYIFLNSLYDIIKEPNLTKQKRNRLLKIFTVSLSLLALLSLLAYFWGYLVTLTK